MIRWCGPKFRILRKFYWLYSFQRISAVAFLGIHALIILSCVEINGRFTLDHAWKGWRWVFSCHPSKLLLPPKTNIFCPAKLSLLKYSSPSFKDLRTGSFETGACSFSMFFPPQLAEPVRFIAWIPGNFQICCATLGGWSVGMIWEIQRGTYFARRVTVADEGWRMLIMITIFVSFLVFIGFHMMPSQSKKSTE